MEFLDLAHGEVVQFEGRNWSSGRGAVGDAVAEHPVPVIDKWVGQWVTVKRSNEVSSCLGAMRPFEHLGHCERNIGHERGSATGVDDLDGELCLALQVIEIAALSGPERLVQIAGKCCFT